MIEAVVGFLFSPDRSRIVLVRKERPALHKGLWNGPGGKVEPKESIKNAMIREFFEETDLSVRRWEHFATVNSSDVWLVHFFRAFKSNYDDVRTMTDEEVMVFNVRDVLHRAFSSALTPNLPMLIHAALNPYVQMLTVKDDEFERRRGLPVSY